MLLVVKKDMQVKDLKKQFHGYFPLLKIEFFRTAHDVNGGNNKSNMLENELYLEDQIGDLEGSLEFEGNVTVAAFEQMFADQFKLNVQVFRKSGNLYIETTETDDWTLEQAHKEALNSQVRTEGAESDFTDRDKWE